MKKTTKDTIVVYGALTVFTCGIFPVLMEPSEAHYEAGQAVNLFPVDASSKNYRVDAFVHSITHFGIFYIQNTTYELINVTWPNGGTVEADCNPGHPVHANERIKCTIGDEDYVVEFNEKNL